MGLLNNLPFISPEHRYQATSLHPWASIISFCQNSRDEKQFSVLIPDSSVKSGIIIEKVTMTMTWQWQWQIPLLQATQQDIYTTHVNKKNRRDTSRPESDLLLRTCYQSIKIILIHHECDKSVIIYCSVWEITISTFCTYVGYIVNPSCRHLTNTHISHIWCT